MTASRVHTHTHTTMTSSFAHTHSLRVLLLYNIYIYICIKGCAGRKSFLYNRTVWELFSLFPSPPERSDFPNLYKSAAFTFPVLHYYIRINVLFILYYHRRNFSRERSTRIPYRSQKMLVRGGGVSFRWWVGFSASRISHIIIILWHASVAAVVFEPHRMMSM